LPILFHGQKIIGGKAVTAGGMGFAFLVSVAYIILGGYLGKKLEKI